DSDYKEIIFGDIAKFVENMFYHCFSSILFRDLETVDKRMYSFSDDDNGYLRRISSSKKARSG
ncbi:hypothetical protein NHG31_06525, partial [Aerococcaceae bacterium NML171108]|nr:hypothetical protein [Aerococcaceae bacterium NML171108]